MFTLLLLLSPKERDRKRVKHLFGLLDPAVLAKKAEKPGGLIHHWGNYWAEWSRSDPQRSGKLFHDLLIAVIVLLVIILIPS